MNLILMKLTKDLYLMLLLHDTVKLLETIDGFYQRMRRHFGMTDKGFEKSLRGMKMFMEVIDEYRHFFPKNHSYRTTDK